MGATHRLGSACFVVLAVAAAAQVALANCTPGWLSGPGLQFPGVENGRVYAATTWDPDGPGPAPEQLVVGGQFGGGGDPNVARISIARWDGASWQALGTGMDYIEAQVLALTSYNGELIAGGRFTTAGGAPCYNIARWDGTSWQALGVGMWGSSAVDALTVYNGELIAGGSFDTAGGVTCYNIARWDGTRWHALGTEGTGMNSMVWALTVYNGELIAGGWFTTAGGVSANYIARWDGTNWQLLGTGMAGGWPPVYVSALGVYNGELIAGGRFETAGGVSANNIARWNGTIWQPLGTGMAGGSNYHDVCALTVYNGELIAGGRFGTAGVRDRPLGRRELAGAGGGDGWCCLSWRFCPDGLQRRVDRGRRLLHRRRQPGEQRRPLGLSARGLLLRRWDLPDGKLDRVRGAGRHVPGR
jgi:hypothetical protein